MPENPLRVAMFCESYAPGVNGVATAVQELTRQLRQVHHVNVLAPQAPGLPAEKDLLLLPAIRLPFKLVPYPITNLFARRQIRKRLRSVHCDIVHANLFYLTGWLALRLARSQRVPCVITCHSLYGSNVTYLPQALQRPFGRFVDRVVRYAYTRADAVIAPSHIAAAYAKKCGAKRVEVIPNYPPLPANTAITDTAKREIRQELKLPETAPFLVYVGRLAPEKNVGLMVRAFGRLNHAEAWLVIAGHGKETEEISRLASQQPNAERILLVGQLKRQQLSSLYATATALVLPAKYETQGLVVHEAQGCGLPAIVMDQGGAQEGVEDGVTGCVIKATEKDLAAGYKPFLEDAAWRQKLSTNCRRAAEARTPAVTAINVMKLYRSLL